MTGPVAFTDIRRFRVPPEERSTRVDLFLSGRNPDLSRARIQQLMKEGRVFINGEPCEPSDRIAPEDRIDMEVPPPAGLALKPEAIPLSVLYEDRWLLIVDKPAGLVVHPAPGHPAGTLVNALLGRGLALSSMAGPFKPGIIHRLDKDTSGILVVAKDDATHRAISRQFSDRSVERVYQAIVKGVVAQDEGTIREPIGRDPKRRQKMTVRSGAHSREAITRYRVLKRFSNATFLELYPQTGRTHQLRVHLAHVGHPILGDRRYGAQQGAPRQALHAHRLGFTHPATRKKVRFVSPLPEELQQTLKRLAP
ncbi:MAG: RluA family pseudouridine synthase [Candidatus Omnitrophica bacterium]|nr:RluA family pseudouridine synthase [Candidatus Omnitrophota bacterium]